MFISRGAISRVRAAKSGGVCLDVRFKLRRVQPTALLHARVTPSPPVLYDLLTCVDPACLGTDGTRKAATEPAIASVLTTVPFMASEEEQNLLG